jgi:hypothetical protein
MSLTRRSLMAAAGFAAPPAPVVTDTFTRADSTTTMGNAETGQAWSALGGVWGILSNKGYPVSGTNPTASVDGGFDDGYVQATWNRQASHSGLLFRCTNSANFLLASSASTTHLWRNVAGSFLQLATNATAVWTTGATQTMRVEFVGSAIEIYIEGVLRLSHTLSAPDTATFAGIAPVGIRSVHTNERFDNFEASTL